MDLLSKENSTEVIDPNWDNREKLNWLMDRYGDMIIRLAYTYVRSDQAAEDIAQDVFLKCYEKLKDFRGDSSYKTWLYKITVNKCKDYKKTWSFRNIIVTDVISTFQKSSNGSFEQEVFMKEAKQEISIKVLSLPVKYREIIILYYYEHLSLAEISKLLNINMNTIKSRLSRGKKMLEKPLKGLKIHE
ncbi:sigma-70 family RNA polymerase sigma factor [Neobacillus drentensis]|uniref:sigma-70 family RNA polymerase sigma factor n=1 Tax=Neobacillus drentensis TaxID=220684 RepID=UPI002FFF4CB9